MQKRQLPLQSLIVALCTIFLLASCSSQQTAFHKRKYQPWFVKHHSKVDHTEKLANTNSIEKSNTTQSNSSTEKQSLNAKTDGQEIVLESQSAEVSKAIVAESNLSKIKSIKKALELNAKNESVNADNRLGNEIKSAVSSTDIETTTEGSKDDVEMILYIVLAILLPPLAVFLIHGLEIEFWLSLILTILGYLPGQIYAIYLVLKKYGKV